MKIGIGIPNTMLEVSGDTLITWARRAEERGFSSLASIGRIAYPSYDELIVFAAAAAVTERIGFLTNVLLAPVHPTALLAKATASLDRISQGRLTLGLGVGGRPDDYAVTEGDLKTRGRRFDRQLEELHDAWAGKPIAGSDRPVGPTTVRGMIPILFGGSPTNAAPRAVRWGGGYTIGGAPPEQVKETIAEFRHLFADHGGEGEPRIAALQYFSLGEDRSEESLHNLRAYYAFAGEWTERIAQGAARTAGDIRARTAAYEEAGIDEILWDPTVPHADQVDRLADLLL